MPKRLTELELNEKIKMIDNNYKIKDYSKYKNNNSRIELIHICNRILETSFKKFQEGKCGCSCEKNNERLLRKEKYLLNKSKQGRKYLLNSNYLIDLFKNEEEYECLTKKYSGNRLNKIKIKHKKCNYIFSMRAGDFKNNHQRCPLCAVLKRRGAELGNGANQIFNYLKETSRFKNIEEKFLNCKDKRRLPFDFIDKDNNLIEFDGEQHFNSKKRGFENAKKHDNIKNIFCKNNFKTLLRIPYNEEKNIKSILDLFYSKNFDELKKYDIYLISKNVNLNETEYYQKMS